jgi:hypothetical protein
MKRRQFLSRVARYSAAFAVGKTLLGNPLPPFSTRSEATDQSTAAEGGGMTSPELKKAREWIAGSLFNLAIDYWGTDWVQELDYGTGYTRQSYLPVLKELQLGFLQIYAKGESGRTSFKSATHSEHANLAPDILPFFRELARETGTKLILYWSGLEDSVAGEQHLDWRCVDENQMPIRTFTAFTKLGPYTICPQSPFFDEWVSVQLREVLSLSDASGMWVDGTGIGPCYCSRCVGRFRRESGFTGTIPQGLAWERYWAKVQYEFRKRWVEFVRTLKPDFLTSFGNITVRKEFLEDRDWCSGDRYSPNNHRLHISIPMRRYATVGLPYEAWICDTQMCHNLHDLRPRTKSLDRMLQEGATILANGGQWTYWTFPSPSGALVPSRMRQAAKAARFARERREVCLGAESVGWTAVVDMLPKNRWFDDNLLGTGKALIQLHRSPVFIDETSLTDDMSYELIVLPEQLVVPAEAVQALESFVRRGGRLLTTGASINSPELQNLLGVRLAKSGVADEAHMKLKGEGYAGVYAPWDHLELAEAEQFYPAYYSSERETLKSLPVNWSVAGLVDEENPQKAPFPGATVRKLGKGVAIHIPTDVFSVYWKYGYLDILSWLREIVNYLQPAPFFRTDAQSYVEVVLRRKQDSLLVHFINGSAGRDLSYVHTEDLFVDEIPALGPITCWIRCARRPENVTWEPEGKRTETSWQDGVLKVTLPRLEIHTCLKVPGWTQVSLKL